MGFSAVTIIAYLSAFSLSCLLTVFLLRAGLQERWKLPLSLAALIQTLWLGVLTASLLYNSVSEKLLLSLESTQLTAWLVAFGITLKQCRQEPWPPRMKLLNGLGLAIWLVSLLDIATGQYFGATSIAFELLLLSILCLVCLEQLVRNANGGRFIRLIGLSLALVFLFDVYLYAQGMISRSLDLLLWQARAALLMAASFLITGAGLLFRDNDEEPASLGLSRPMVFYSTSLLLTSGGVLLLALGSYYVRTLGGEWGIYLFTLMFFFSLAALSALFLSNRIRQSIQVWISKHFFRHKYDYRREWLNVNQALAKAATDREVYATVYSVVAAAFHASGGSVWVRRGPYYRRVHDSSNRPETQAATVGVGDAFIGTMADKQWVFAPKAQDGPLTNYNDQLPDWIVHDPNIQLLVPLITQQHLMGFVILERTTFDSDLTWEDLDILKTMGRQLANHILIYTQEAMLSESRQLDTYHKLSAFIMHDMNNLIAQLGLVVKNSERHKNNPAFVDDMIRTVSHSVDRLNQLMQKFSRTHRDVISEFSILEAVRASISACSSGKPTPQLMFFGTDYPIKADRDRFVLALKHLIKNAQDATDTEGTIEVRIETYTDNLTSIKIIDTGMGMTQEFIDQQLFKPFETTKEGQGMGIGVYLTRSYLEELGASLDVESQPGVGTTMTIHLGQPRTDGATRWTSLTESY